MNLLFWPLDAPFMSALRMSIRLRPGPAIFGAFLILVLIVAVLVSGQSRPSADVPRIFEVDLRASAGTAAQLFWSSDDQFSEAQSVRVPLHPLRGEFERLVFPIPPRGIRWLRFDPTDAPGDVFMGRARLLDSSGALIEEFDARSFRPQNQILSITRQDAGTRIAITPGGADPFLLLSLSHLDQPSFAKRLRLVTPASLLVVTVITMLVVTATFAAFAIAAFGRRGASASATDGRWWRVPALWLAALFLVVLWAKLWFIRAHPVTSPYWDQWDAQAAFLFLPYQQMQLPWRGMFSLHNEHRIFFTRLLALDLMVINGEWEPRLEQVVNAGMHALTAVMLTVSLWIAAGRRRLDLMVLLSGLTFAVPFAWQNLLVGFQSAFYLLLFFFVPALWLTTACRAGTAAWWVGWCCALFGLFTAAGGVLTPVTILAMSTLAVIDDRRTWRDAASNAAASLALIGLGAAVASPPLAYHDYLRVKNVADFVSALGSSLAWPWVDLPLVSVLVWLPLVGLLAGAIARRGRTNQFERLAIGIGLWVALQSAALAYGRGAGGVAPANRYLDFLSLGWVANTMALAAVIDRARVSGAMPRFARVVLGLWLAAGVVGIDRLTAQTEPELSMWMLFWTNHPANVRRYVIADDTAEFKRKGILIDLPYFGHDRLAALLQEPDIRRVLPRSVREPIFVQPRAGTGDGFVPEGSTPGIPHDPLARGWVSLTSEGRRGQGRFESAPAGPCRAGGHLAFAVSGYLGWPGQYLAVRDVRTGVEQPVRPTEVARETWVEARVPCPPGEFVIVAADATPESWFGFREPVEIGWTTPIVERVIDNARLMFVAALALMALAVRRSGAETSESSAPASYVPSP